MADDAEISWGTSNIRRLFQINSQGILSREFEHITTRPNEIFYWVTILVSNTLGTALGDFVATTTGLGFERGSLEFAGLLVLVAAAHFFTKIPKSAIFWSAYVLTRPLGGLGLGRITSSLVISAFIVVGIIVTFRWEGRSATEPENDPHRSMTTVAVVAPGTVFLSWIVEF